MIDTCYPSPGPGIHFFPDSPPEGDPACLCSVCLKAIPEFDAEGLPYICARIWSTENGPEARFHDECIPEELLDMVREARRSHHARRFV